MSKADYKGPRQTERRDRPNHTITRKAKGHPRRQARRERAYARGGTLPKVVES